MPPKRPRGATTHVIEWEGVLWEAEAVPTGKADKHVHTLHWHDPTGAVWDPTPRVALLPERELKGPRPTTASPGGGRKPRWWRMVDDASVTPPPAERVPPPAV